MFDVGNRLLVAAALQAKGLVSTTARQSLLRKNTKRGLIFSGNYHFFKNKVGKYLSFEDMHILRLLLPNVQISMCNHIALISIYSFHKPCFADIYDPTIKLSKLNSVFPMEKYCSP